jgi:predicted DNA-binding ribbon-helix-helix protein
MRGCFYTRPVPGREYHDSDSWSVIWGTARGEEAMKSPVVKRSIVLAGHKTSVSLENAFWQGLKEIATSRGITLSDLITSIDRDREHGNLSSAVRLFVLSHYQARAA